MTKAIMKISDNTCMKNEAFLQNESVEIFIIGKEKHEFILQANDLAKFTQEHSQPYSETGEDEAEDLEQTPPIDPWDVLAIENEMFEKWSDLTGKQKMKTVLLNLTKGIMAVICLYFFICSLGLLSASFQILAGQTAGDMFTHETFLSNPVTGLIIGILVTVLVQSSSTSTSIIITMVGAGILPIHDAIPIILGTNIGTSVTNTLVALTQAMEKEQFKRAFAGATVHDMFNLLSVLVLLPVEVASGYLEVTTNAIVQSMNLANTESSKGGASVLTDYVVDHVIQVNKTIIQLVAQEIALEEDASMVKTWCEQNVQCVTNFTGNATGLSGDIPCQDILVGIRKCDTSDFLFANTGMSDPLVGGLLLAISLIMLCGCLIAMVKLLSSLLRGNVSLIIKKIINTNFPKPFGWVTGYLAIVVGAILTFLVQSSSVFTSSITPLVGLGVISLKRMYPLTLGSNIGTTGTGMLAALATEGTNKQYALQLAFCNLLFNVTAILIWYPIPFMRRVPIGGAKNLGNITSRYRWFAVLYLISVFFVFPFVLLALSFAGMWVMGAVLITIFVLVIFIVLTNILQQRKPALLPKILQTWEFLPTWLHSLQPYDAFFAKYLLCCKCCNRADFENGVGSEGFENCAIENSSSDSKHISLPVMYGRTEKEFDDMETNSWTNSTYF